MRAHAFRISVVFMTSPRGREGRDKNVNVRAGRPAGKISFLARIEEESNLKGQLQMGFRGRPCRLSRRRGERSQYMPAGKRTTCRALMRIRIALPAAPHHHQDQAKGDHDEQDIGFKVVTAVQKAIPRPQVLCERKRNQYDRSQNQQQPTDAGVQMSRLCETQEVRHTVSDR